MPQAILRETKEMLSFWLWLYYAALWAWDWMQTSTHDPDFPTYKIASIRLIRIECRLKSWSLEIDINWWNCPQFKLFHPIDEAGWRAEYPVRYVYPIDPDQIPV